MTDITNLQRGRPARLVNVRWGFASDWVPLPWAIAQFEAHRSDLQDGLVLEWSEGPGHINRLSPDEVRQSLLREEENAPSAAHHLGARPR